MRYDSRNGKDAALEQRLIDYLQTQEKTGVAMPRRSKEPGPYCAHRPVNHSPIVSLPLLKAKT